MKNILKKIGEFIKYYTYLTIACLIMAFMFRGCKIDRMERLVDINNSKYECTIDSLQTQFDNIKDTLYMVRLENDLLKNTIIECQKDKDYYIDANKDLLNANKNLSKRTITITTK